MPVVMPANAAPWIVVMGMNQSMAFSAGNPGNSTMPANAPANEIVRKMGIIRDGKNADGRRVIRTMLRRAIPHVTSAVDISWTPTIGDAALERQGSVPQR